MMRATVAASRTPPGCQRASTVAARPISRGAILDIATRPRNFIGAGKQGIYRAPTHGHESWHRAFTKIHLQTRDMHRAIISLMEELRPSPTGISSAPDVTPDADLKAAEGRCGAQSRRGDRSNAMMTLE
jgi:hypothetical protein